MATRCSRRCARSAACRTDSTGTSSGSSVPAPSWASRSAWRAACSPTRWSALARVEGPRRTCASWSRAATTRDARPERRARFATRGPRAHPRRRPLPARSASFGCAAAWRRRRRCGRAPSRAPTSTTCSPSPRPSGRAPTTRSCSVPTASCSRAPPARPSWSPSGEIVTPPVALGILPGITRDRVLTCARQRDSRARERLLTIHDAYRASELFLTSSVRGIVAVSQLDGRALNGGEGRPGPITRRVFERYQSRAGDMSSGRT